MQVWHGVSRVSPAPLAARCHNHALCCTLHTHAVHVYLGYRTRIAQGLGVQTRGTRQKLTMSAIKAAQKNSTSAIETVVSPWHRWRQRCKSAIVSHASCADVSGTKKLLSLPRPIEGVTVIPVLRATPALSRVCRLTAQPCDLISI